LLPSGVDEAGGGESLSDDSSKSLLCLFLSEATASVESPRLMRLLGCVQGNEILILIDSGS
jgi:hypothetical protein